MEFKKLIFVLAIAATVIVVMMFGTSYAYYTSTSGTIVDVTTSNIDKNLIIMFEQSEYINVRTGIPISSSDVNTLASKSTFTITTDSSDISEAALKFDLVDVSIASELKVSDFKYSLVCNDGTSNNTIASGTGTNFTSEVLNNKVLPLGGISTSNSTFNINKNYTCDFRIWLLETGQNQNNLMNKKFSGRMRITSMVK